MTGVADLLSSDTEDSQSENGVLDLLDEKRSDELLLKVFSVEYTDGQNGTTIHLFGRTENGERHHIEVGGHDPSFFIREEAHSHRVDNHYAVKRTEKYDDSGDRYKTLHGEPLVRVYTTQSSSVGEMRDLFDETWEADVFYDTRWLIDNEIKTGVRVDTSEATEDEPWLKGEMRVDNGAVQPLSLDETPTPQTRQTVIDIEVASESGFPDTDKAEWPVSTIVAWDNYEDEYVGWLLRPEPTDYVDDESSDSVGSSDGSETRQVYSDHADDADLDELRVFDDESDMLADFHLWMSEDRADIITGWYSNDFDIPYLINRSRELNTYGYQDWSPLGDVWNTKYEPVVKGVECVDMIEAYKKTQIHELDSKKLEDVGQDELGVGKKSVEKSHTEMWKEVPIEFLGYNKVDVELVHRIDEVSGAIDLLDHLRNVAGVDYSDLPGGAIEMIDVVFLRKAAEYGYRLPTAVEPEVGHFHGAYVYLPEPGLHRNAVYPDYSSLYPNVQYQCNISPETLVGTKEDLEESEYTEEDCVWSYIDTTTPPSQKEDKEAREEDMERVFFLKPSVKEGFVRSVLDDIMGLADRYTGGMYEAVKRVRNASWGVMGDSDSYGDGFRLFDWRLAEATTLGGQRVLKGGADYFVDAIDDPEGYIVGGDTDSYMTSLPNAESGEEALEMAFEAAEETNEWLDGFAAETFGLESEDEARMELEIESYASVLFFKGDEDHNYEKGVKKRYAQQMEWDDTDGWYDEPKVKIKGFEYVRSDIAEITKELQYETFQVMLDGEGDMEERAKEISREKIDELFSGDRNDEIGKPFGIGQSLRQYGSADRTPQPQYRGAKFSNEHVYGGEAITEGDKPKYWYIEEGQTGPELRATYNSTTREDGRYVDAISAHEWDDLPEGVRIDYPKMAEKTIIDPMEDIWNTMQWGVEWAKDYVEQSTPPEYYRDDEQAGLDASRFM